MTLASRVEIIDITQGGGYEEYLHRCMTNYPPRRYKRRIEYLKDAIPRGFHKKLLIFNDEVVGQIEYSPPEASYYPIIGGNIVVVNCIWVLRRAKGHNLGKQLLENAIRSEKDADGFATVALESHWSRWFRRRQIEKLGFKSLDSIEVAHKTKYKGRVFRIHLMWIPSTENARQPKWNKQRLLEGVIFCMAHPLYRPQTYEEKQILERR